MKKLSIVLLAVALLCALAVAFYAVTSVIRTEADVKISPAAARAEDFVRLKGEEALGSIGDYYFADVTVKMISYSPFSAQWVTLTVDPLPEDEALLYQNVGPADIESVGSGTLSVTVLTRDPGSARSVKVDYYILGRYHQVKAKAAGN